MLGIISEEIFCKTSCFCFPSFDLPEKKLIISGKKKTISSITGFKTVVVNPKIAVIVLYNLSSVSFLCLLSKIEFNPF